MPADAGLEFRDPWGNHVQVVDYRDIQFTKAPEVLGAWSWRTAKTNARWRSSPTDFACQALAPQAPLDAFGDDTAGPIAWPADAPP